MTDKQQSPVPEQEATLLRAWQKLQGSHPIAVYCPIIHITDSLKAGIFLSQLVYWSKRGTTVVQNNGWIFKKTREITNETGLTERQQDTIKMHLLKQGLLEVKRTRIGMNSGLAFRVNLQVLGQKIAEYLQVDLNSTELNLHSLRNNVILHRQLFTQRVAFHRDLVHLTGEVNSALMLSFVFRQIVEKYQYNQTKCISITISNWQKLIGLSYHEQYNARKRLIELGILTEKNLTASRRLYLFLHGEELLNFFIRQLPKILNRKSSSKKTLESLKTAQFTEFHTSEYGIPQKDINHDVKDNKRICHLDSTKLEIRTEQNFKLDKYKSPNMYSTKLEILNRKVLDYSSSNYKYSYYTLSVPSFAQSVSPKLNSQHSVGVVHELKKSCSGLEPGSDCDIDISDAPQEETKLYWARQFSIAERKTAIVMFDNLLQDKSPETKQLLLDEIAGKDNVRTVIGLLRKLILNHNQGVFYPTTAHKIQQGRKIQAAIKQQMAEAEFIKQSETGSSVCNKKIETGANNRETIRREIASIKNFLKM